jgi:hypothetical protein
MEATVLMTPSRVNSLLFRMDGLMANFLSRRVSDLAHMHRTADSSLATASKPF